MNRKKIVLSERQRVCDFRFTSLEFIYLRSLDIRANWFSTFPVPVKGSCPVALYFYETNKKDRS